ncbi:MAG: S8 family serine peptidase [Vicinamibacterales bacterium]
MTVKSWLTVVALLVGVGVVSTRATVTAQAPRTVARIAEAADALTAIDQGLQVHAARAERSADTPSHAIRDASRARGYLPGRVIVKFKDGASTVARSGAMRVARASAMSQPDHADFELMSIPVDADAEAVAAALGARDDVEYAQAAYRVYPYFKPNDALYSRQWNLTDLGMEQAWDINQGASSSIIVAVVDSGMAFRNAVFEFVANKFTDDTGVAYPALGRIAIPFAAAPDLASSGRIVAPRDFIYDDQDPVDLDGHGTHVAGTIGQLTNNGDGVAGMAFNARLMPVKVISGDWDDIFDSPFVGTDDVVARGIRYAADNGARVINMSIGRSGAPAPVVESALRYAVSLGAFVAIAGGNDFERGNPVERLAEIANRIDGVISVAATSRGQKRAFYSTTGNYIEIAGPGGDRREGGTDAMILQQTYSSDFTDTFLLPPSQYRAPRFDVFSYVYFQGTSMATPHVSGLAALLMQQGLTNPAAIEAAIKHFATDLGTAGRDNDFGYGLINPRATLRGLGLLR